MLLFTDPGWWPDPLDNSECFGPFTVSRHRDFTISVPVLPELIRVLECVSRSILSLFEICQDQVEERFISGEQGICFSPLREYVFVSLSKEARTEFLNNEYSEDVEWNPYEVFPKKFRKWVITKSNWPLPIMGS